MALFFVVVVVFLGGGGGCGGGIFLVGGRGWRIVFCKFFSLRRGWGLVIYF